jgi:hypothetical protein
MVTHVGRRLIVMLMLGIVAASAIAALIVGGHATAAGAKHSKLLTRPSKQVLRHYAIFDRHAKAADALPPAYLTGPEPEIGSVTRKPETTKATLAAAEDYTQWATAEGSEICTVIRSATGEEPGTNQDCNNAEYLEAHHELIAGASFIGRSSTAPEPGVVNVVHGLAPNGVNTITLTFADGTTVNVPVVENTFIYSLSQPEKLLRMTWVEASGYQGVE